MKLRPWLCSGTMAALAMAVVAAVAQDTPKAEPQKKEEEPAEDVIPVRWNEVSVGYTTFRTNAGLSRYARPSEGLSLHSLKLLTPGTEKFPYYARLTVKGMPRQDSLIDGYVAFNHGNTIVRGSRRQYSYYSFEWQSKDPSEDNETDVIVDHNFGRGIGGFFSYRSSERDGRYAAPRDPDHTRSKTVAGGLGGKVLGGNLGISASDRRTFDDTGAQPGTLQRSIDASYARDFGDSLSLEGSLGYSRIEQAGWKSSNVRTMALSGAWDLGPSTGLQFHFGRQDLDLPIILNAYVQKRLITSARLMHRWNGWSLQFGMQHKESERVRADQTFVDVPKWNVYDARLAGKIGPAHVTLKGSWEDLLETAQMGTQDNRQLLWDDRATFQAKVDGGGDLFTAYGTYTYRFQQNKQRGVDIRWNNVALGGSYVFSPAVNAFAEFSYEDFHVEGGAETGQDLDFYFPNSRSFAMGINWAKDQSLSASASLNYYESANVRGTQLTLSMRKRLAADHDLELMVAPWRHDDRQFGLTGYRSTLLAVRYTVRF